MKTIRSIWGIFLALCLILTCVALVKPRMIFRYHGPEVQAYAAEREGLRKAIKVLEAAPESFPELDLGSLGLTGTHLKQYLQRAQKESQSISPDIEDGKGPVGGLDELKKELDAISLRLRKIDDK